MDICECYKLPPYGNFIVGKKYIWSFIIDGVSVKDENEDTICFTEIKWLWYFKQHNETGGLYE